jgi:hypothetical protein
LILVSATETTEDTMYPIQIRQDHANGFEIDFATAVNMAMGANEEICRVVVTAVHTEAGTIAGTPVSGMDAEVYARRIKYGEDSDAQVSISGIMSHSPEVAMLRAQCYMLAAQIAAAANAAAAAKAAGEVDLGGLSEAEAAAKIRAAR